MKERLQKIIAAAGLASRRKAEELIVQGRVVVNGVTVTELGVKADPASDHIRVDGRLIHAEVLEYYAVHKPQGILSAASDARKRPVVTDLVRSSRRLYPAGRLDFQSEGLMILTNDGELTKSLTAAGNIEKVYRVKVRGVPTEQQLDKLRKGLRGGKLDYAPCRIRKIRADRNCWLEVRLKQGKNRQVRTMFDGIGHAVMRLRRVAIGPVELGDLKPGASRRLSDEEVRALRAPKRGNSADRAK